MISAEDLDLMRHALSWPGCWRNFYCVDLGGEDAKRCERLARLGMLRRGSEINDGRDRYYHVTDAGRAILVEAAK